ncbi:MAG: hypothetical protein PHG90_03155 [Clostridia bacterium]|nr:hypothetical protein [Clostridia bacterium]
MKNNFLRIARECITNVSCSRCESWLKTVFLFVTAVDLKVELL